MTQDQLIDRRRNWEARVEMGVLQLPKEVLSTHEKLVYVALCGHADRSGGAFPVIATLAKEASCSTRQVFRALTTLEERGLVTRSAQTVPGRGQVGNLYSIYGLENYIPVDRGACVSRGADMTDSRTPHDTQAYLKQLQDNKETFSPTEREVEIFPEEPISEDDVSLEDVSAVMREAVDYFLEKTRRKGIGPAELSAIRALEKIHTPSRVTKEIRKAVERYEKNGKGSQTLTLEYIYDALKHQCSIRGAQSKAAIPKDDKYKGAYL